jgi:hypothetical protein
MKLYLATNSLNIDNILSTECIAPYSFYLGRTYGYDSFRVLDYLPFKNVLVMFSKIPNFQVLDNEQDCRPVILEINIDEIVNPLNRIGEYEGTNIFSTDTIIRLSPFNTKLLFYNLNDLNHSRLSCSDSLTNKLGDRFRFELCKAEFNLVRLLSAKFHVDDVCKDYALKVEQDNKLNSIKGFIFGYYLGISKSVSPNSAKLLKIQKRIYDIAAAIKNSGVYGHNSFLDELEKLDNEYRMNDPCIKKCKVLWEQTLEELAIPSESLNKLLEQYDVNSVLKTTFMKKKGLQPSIVFKQYGYTNIEQYRNNLKNYTINIIREDQKEQLSSFDVLKTFDLDPSYETCMLAGEDTDSMTFNRFIDSILWHGEVPTPDTLRTDRFRIATEITKSAKNIWETQDKEWQNSSAQIFMNDLRQNIKNFTPFNIDMQENIILKSIAAFVLKGEDYDAVIQFCEDNSFSDYKYALALWGAAQGYVRMSKPIINGLTKDPAFSDTYKAIITLLYNVESAGDLPYKENFIRELDEPKTITETSSSEDQVASNIWRMDIKKYAESVIKRDKAKLLKSLDDALVQNADNQDSFIFITMLDNFDGWKPGKNGPSAAWTRMQEHYVPDYYQRVGKSTKNQNVEKEKEKPQKGLFDGTIDSFQHAAQTVKSALSSDDSVNIETSKLQLDDVRQSAEMRTGSKKGKSILEDTTWIHECSRFITDPRASRQFTTDMEWFVGNHKNTYHDKSQGDIPGHYADQDKTNIRVQERLRAYLENRVKPRNEKTQWLAEIYANIPINKIMGYITKVYGC